jgi:hypothetical protein
MLLAVGPAVVTSAVRSSNSRREWPAFYGFCFAVDNRSCGGQLMREEMVR